MSNATVVSVRPSQQSPQAASQPHPGSSASDRPPCSNRHAGESERSNGHAGHTNGHAGNDHQYGNWIPVRIAARIAGVSTSTIRSWCNAHELECRRTIGHARRISRQSLMERLGFDVGDSDESKIGKNKVYVLYARTSSEGQSESLKRQCERLKEWAGNNGIKPDSFLLYSEVCSAFASRKSLYNVVDLIISGRVSQLVCENNDRIGRDSVNFLIEHLCRNHNVPIIAIAPEEKDQTDDEIFVGQILRFLNVHINKINGKRGGRLCKAQLSDDALTRLRQLRKAGRSIREIVQVLQDEGFRAVVASKPGPVIISRNVIRRVLAEEAKLKDAVQPEPQPLDDAVAAFISETCERGLEFTEDTRNVFSAFTDWCESKGLPVLSQHRLASKLKRIGFTVKTKRIGKRVGRIWFGFRLRPDIDFPIFPESSTRIAGNQRAA